MGSYKIRKRAVSTPKVVKMSQNIDFKKEDKCECGSDEFIAENGFITCIKCGLCKDRHFVNEQIPFEDKNPRTSRGNCEELASGLGSYVGTFYSDCRDIFGHNAPKGAFLDDSRWVYLSKKYNRSILIPKQQRKAVRYKSLLNEILGILEVNEVFHLQCHTVLNLVFKNYKQFKNESVNYSASDIVAATIYWVSRDLSTKIQCDTIISAINSRGYVTTMSDLMQVTTIIKQLLKETHSFKVFKAEDYLESLVTTLNESLLKNEQLARSLHDVASQILGKIPSTSPTRGGTNPRIFCAVTIFCAAIIIAHKRNEKVILNQRNTSSVLDIAEYSFRDIYLKRLKPLFKNHPAWSKASAD
jgi:transcription initiation factor TFIIIB Brf1 subunit/transcription initiation factor TFIIB